MKYKCAKCGHEWESRIEGEPQCCPRCKSYKYKDIMPVKEEEKKAND